jgi:hypothetical protein
VAFDFFVNRVAMLQHAANQRLGEQARLGFFDGRRRQFKFFAPMRRALFVLDRGGALGIPELRQLEFEIFRRVQVVLKQKLHRAFARFASFAHESNLQKATKKTEKKF